MSQNITSKLIEMAEEGAINWQGIARECLARMSEDDVADMVREMEWDDSWEDDEEEEEEVEDEEEDEEEEEDEDDEKEDDNTRVLHVKLRNGREFHIWITKYEFDHIDNVEDFKTYVMRFVCYRLKLATTIEMEGFTIINETALCEWLGF